MALKIGFDAKRAFLNTTGLGNYSRSLIMALSQFFPDNTYFLYTPKTKYPRLTGHFHARKNLEIRQPPPIPLFRNMWRSKFMTAGLKKDALDIYHGLSHELPFGIRKTGIKSVVTIHDLIFFRYPEYYKLADRKIYEAKFRYACKHADAIIAVSEQTKRDLQTFLQVPEEKIRVIYQSCNPAFSEPWEEEQLYAIQSRYQLPPRYVLYVGTIEIRKNLLQLIQALQKLPEEVKCVVVGKPTAYLEEIRVFMHVNGMEDRVHFFHDVPYDILPAFFQMAELFVYPSRFEGFGIPVLEAITAGIPVIAAKGSCLEEAGGPGSIYLDPDDVQGMADAIAALWDDPQRSAEMVFEGLQYALRFSDKQIAGEVAALYESLIRPAQAIVPKDRATAPEH